MVSAQNTLYSPYTQAVQFTTIHPPTFSWRGAGSYPNMCEGGRRSYTLDKSPINLMHKENMQIPHRLRLGYSEPSCPCEEIHILFSENKNKTMTTQNWTDGFFFFFPLLFRWERIEPGRCYGGSLCPLFFTLCDRTPRRLQPCTYTLARKETTHSGHLHPQSCGRIGERWGTLG